MNLSAGLARSQHQAAMAARVLRIVLYDLSPRDGAMDLLHTNQSGRDICLTAWGAFTLGPMFPALTVPPGLPHRRLPLPPVISLMNSASSGRYGLPSKSKMSWNHMAGSRSVYGFCQESQGKLVCVLPATKPQL